MPTRWPRRSASACRCRIGRSSSSCHDRRCRRSTGRHTRRPAAWRRGAYVLADAPDGKPEVLLLATGSEVSLCVTASEQLASEGIKARVVSMPSWELFDDQSQEYRDRVLPPEVTARVAVEEASTFGWERYTGLQGRRPWYAHVRPVGADEGRRPALRVRCGPRGQRRPGTGRTSSAPVLRPSVARPRTPRWSGQPRRE